MHNTQSFTSTVVATTKLCPPIGQNLDNEVTRTLIPSTGSLAYDSNERALYVGLPDTSCGVSWAKIQNDPISDDCAVVRNDVPILGIIGIGCSGAYLLNKLSRKYNMLAFEAGHNSLNDGVTYNLAIGAPSSHLSTDTIAPQTASIIAPAPVGAAQQWSALTFLPLYNLTTNADAGTIAPSINPNNAVFNSQLASWSQGLMLGGSHEHIQGVYVNPSKSRCNWWASLLSDTRYSFDNLFPKLMETEDFRAYTPPTSSTYDGTSFAPRKGPSFYGSFPINRGKDGPIKIMQSSPNSFATVLSQVVYDKFNGNLGYSAFKLEPVVSSNGVSETFNSGVDICVTTTTEAWLDYNRTRSSTARAYLPDNIMQRVDVDSATGYSPTNFFFNNGIHRGVNGHTFDLFLQKIIQRIVFQTKPGYPLGQNYWTNNGFVDPNAFVRPLKAIGIEYGPTISNKTFVPMTHVICTLGTIGTPALLMQSGIGPSSVLTTFGIPQLLVQDNLGRHISNHVGAVLRWSGNASFWNTTNVSPAGTTAGNGYLPGFTGTDFMTRRKFQYFSGFSATTVVGITPTPTWTMSLYDLNTKSTGSLAVAQNWETIMPTNTVQSTLRVTTQPNYYSDVNQEDRTNLCWLLRELFNMIRAADPTSIFYVPVLPSTTLITPLADSLFTNPANPTNDQALLVAFTPAITAQTHFVGSCGMGNDPLIHCVDKNFLLRGTSNVRVCDGSSTPLEKDGVGNVYPVQNDGNTARGKNTFSVICAEQLLGSL